MLNSMVYPKKLASKFINKHSRNAFYQHKNIPPGIRIHDFSITRCFTQQESHELYLNLENQAYLALIYRLQINVALKKLNNPSFFSFAPLTVQRVKFMFMFSLFLVFQNCRSLGCLSVDRFLMLLSSCKPLELAWCTKDAHLEKQIKMAVISATECYISEPLFDPSTVR